MPEPIDHAVDVLHHDIQRGALAILEAASGIQDTSVALLD
jgi:hypothetical protein